MDLTAETFAHILAKRRQFRGTTAEEEQAWLFAVARSQLSHYWRRSAVERRACQRYGIEPAVLAEDGIARVEELAGLPDLRQSLAAALDELPAAQRRAIQLRVVQELDYPEIAADLAISENLARKRVSRGLRTLARFLEPPTGGEPT